MPKRSLLLLTFSCASVLAEDSLDLAQYVNPFIGTGEGAPDNGIRNSAGNTPPGAASPFGMTLFSPDTTSQAGGYRWQHNAIQGFSLTHFSGRGISCYQDLPILPVLRQPAESPGGDWPSYASTFSHQNEEASPGYYGVTLDNGIRAETTVTTRTGFARFTFPARSPGAILLNAGGSANGNWGETWVKIGGNSLLYGAATSGNCGGWFSYTVYFVAIFDRPFLEFGTWNGSRIEPGSSASSGEKPGAYLVFDNAAGPQIQMKVALSFVSFTNAYASLCNENPAWDFEAARARARSAWNARLNRVVVEGGTDEQKTIFYTALYHSFLHPNTFSDSNGEYLGFDGQVHSAPGFTQYHNFPSWDFYRTEVPLLALLAPEASQMIQSLVNDALQDPGGGLPRWQHANTNSGGMIGDGQDAVIASAYAFGVRDFDAKSALAAMDKGASQVGTTSGGQIVRQGLAEYLALGYVSTATEYSGSRTLEYATDDFCIGQFARALGDENRYRLYLKRAQNWRNLWHDGYFVPRNPDGSFLANFSPTDCCNHFVEGSPSQYVWMVPFNFRGLFQMMGGNAAAIARLDRHLRELNAGPGSEYAFLGNEPGLKTPWVYASAGAAWRTRQVVRRVLLELFQNAPGGMPGNDDGGVLSSWGVFASIGLFPQIPGIGGFVVGSPLFPRITVRLANGGTIQIVAPAASATAAFVQVMKLNGSDYASPWIWWDTVARGAELEFALSESPNPSWGASPEAAPPSYDAN